MTSSSIKSVYRFGRLGLLVRDNDDHVYGVTGSHVTNHSIDGWIYVKDIDGDFTKLGKISKCYDVDVVTDINKDINIFRIEPNWKKHCKNTFAITKGAEFKTLFSTKKLHTSNERHVFLINCELEEGNDNIRYKYGSIPSIKDHKNVNIDFNKFFLVEQVQNKPFFEGGDSGGTVLWINDSGHIDIVGLVVGKYEQDLKKSKRERVLCLHIKYGLQILKDDFDIELSENEHVRDTQLPIIKPGIKIWVKTACNIQISKECDIDLCEHLIKLFDCIKTFVPHRKESFWTNTEYMKTLSKHVNNRSDIVPFESPTIDHKCYLHAILGCDFIFSEKLKAAEKQLQIALRYVGKTHAPIRLLCKIFSYSTWLLLKQNKLTEMKEILDHGIAQTEYIKYNDVKIHDSVGYFYFDYARYFIKKDDIRHALKMANESLSYFESFEFCGIDPTEKKALVWVMIAKLNLNCGEYFEKINFNAVDIDKAKMHIKKLYENLENLPVVQQVCYYMVKADFHFRMGQYQDALQAALESRNLSIQHKLKEEFKKSHCKVICLQRLKEREVHKKETWQTRKTRA